MNKSESKYFNTAIKMDKALITLLEEKPFEYISVSEICKKANVNRSTFYLHYENMIDLLNETAGFILVDFMAYFDDEQKSIAKKLEGSALNELNFITDEYLHPYLSYVKENRRLFSTALLYADTFGFNEVFQRLYENVFNPVLERFNYPIADRKYAMMFYLNGITAIVKEWLKDGCEKNIVEISGIIYECIFGTKNGV